MRQDKLTTKFQDAIGSAQSIALAHDNQFMEPLHLLAALLADTEGSTRSLLERAGVNVGRLERDVKDAVDRLPKVTGQGGDVQISRDLMNLLNLTEKEAMKAGDEYISTEMALLCPYRGQDRSRTSGQRGRTYTPCNGRGHQSRARYGQSRQSRRGKSA